jgi:hypothetical protein
MRLAPSILALVALLATSASAQASPQSWGELNQELREAATEVQRVALVEEAWEQLGPRDRMRAIERLSLGAGDATERFLVTLLGKEGNAFLRRRLAMVLGRFATRGDTLAALDRLAEKDGVTELDSGSCWTGKGHARKEAEMAAERVRTRRAQVIELGDDSRITEGADLGVSWFGVDAPAP